MSKRTPYEEAVANLPNYILFPREVYKDTSEEEAGCFWGMVEIGGEWILLMPDYKDEMFQEYERGWHYQYPDRVYVTWSIEVEQGLARAYPTFRGIVARQGVSQGEALDLQEVCRKLGMAEPRLLPYPQTMVITTTISLR